MIAWVQKNIPNWGEAAGLFFPAMDCVYVC